MTGDKVKGVFTVYKHFLESTFPGYESLQLKGKETKVKCEEISRADKIGHFIFMCSEAQEFVDDGRTEKAMRWLGFLQGVFWAYGFFTLDDLKKHSMP